MDTEMYCPQCQDKRSFKLNSVSGTFKTYICSVCGYTKGEMQDQQSLKEETLSSASMQSAQSQIPRRQFIAGMTAAAVTVPFAVSAASSLPALAASSPPSPFPSMPTGSTTTTEDREQMLWQLGITPPTLPPRLEDPNRPSNAWPVDSTNPEGNWTDSLGHTVARGGFGQWITYDDDTGLAGGAASPFGAYDLFSHPGYKAIDLLKMKDGAPVRTPEDWWTKRRPEIFRDVQDSLYGHIPDRDRWPAITWSVGPVSTGTASGVAYKERVVTGTIDISSYPQVRNVPVIQGTLRTPLDKAGQPVPVIIVFDSSFFGGPVNTEWQYTAPYGYGVCTFNWSALQPDSGGANMSSYIIGLINRGNWRHPLDWGALAAWSWGISRLIDYFETDPEVDATRIGLQGHSRFGKATLVAAAYDERIGAAFPSSAGQLGTALARRTWGEDLELVSGADTEYHWVAGNIMRFCGELHPGTYWPRKVANLTVDAHATMSLIAPRVVMTNGGTDTPPGFGDAWTDPRGMYLSTALSSPVWNLLGWPGLIIPEGSVFTSGAGEAIGGTPPIDVAFIDGTTGWRRHHEGHTPAPDWPFFVQLAARHFEDNRPVVTPGQRFTVRPGETNAVGRVQAADADGDKLGNWQIVGGTGLGCFTIDSNSGEIKVAGNIRAEPGHNFTLAVVVDDRKLTSKPEVVSIRIEDR